MKHVGLLVIAMLFLCGSAYAERTVWYVHPDSALNTIQAGLDSCADNDIVLVGPGTYYENIVWPNTQGIHLVGELGPVATIIDGDSAGTVIEITSGIDSNTIVGGFTIQNGYTLFRGAGIRCNMGSSPTITNNIITNNHAGSSGSSGGSGGGLYCDSASSALIDGNTITGNSVGDSDWWGWGSAISCYYSTPTISNNCVTDNVCYGPDTRSGAIHCCYSSPTISDNTIAYNSNVAWFYAEGGGIFCDYSSPTITGNHIIGNFATSAADIWAGGIFCRYSSPIIADNTIKENSAHGVVCWTSSPMLTNNDIDDQYHGINCYRSSPTVDSCTITGNSWGVYCRTLSAPVIHSCNITGNNVYGICNEDTSLTVNAESNWWGDSTGPYHPTLNPDGLGDAVSDYVDVEPWLSWPVGVEERPVFNPVETHENLTATIFRGPLRLPEGKKCKVFDITGRMVEPDRIAPGIYFIEVDGVVTQKVVKVR